MKNNDIEPMKYVLFYSEEKDCYTFYRRSENVSWAHNWVTHGPYENFVEKLAKDTKKFPYVKFDGGMIKGIEFGEDVKPMPGSLVKKIIEELKEKGIGNIIE